MEPKKEGKKRNETEFMKNLNRWKQIKGTNNMEKKLYKLNKNRKDLEK
jgi:hypothetical protein